MEVPSDRMIIMWVQILCGVQYPYHGELHSTTKIKIING